MATNFPTPPTKIISWQQEVLYADPQWHQGYTRPIVYEFSNGKTFQWDPNVYTD